MKRYTLILTALLFLVNLYAQEKKWELNDCILYAVKHSPKVNNQKSTNSIYHQDYLEAIGRLLPSISASTSAGFNFGRAVGDDNTYVDVNSFSNNYNISASLTLFDGLANYTKVRIGRINKLIGKEELEDVKDMVAYDTMEAFFNVLYNQDLVKVSEEQLEESSKSYNQIKRMEELDIKGMPDVAEAEAKVAEDTYNLTRQKNLLTISIIQLKEKMNFPIDEDLEIQGNDYTEIIVTKVPETPMEIYEKSKEYNSRAQVAESAFKSTKLNYKASKGNLMPSISMNAGISTGFFRYMDGSEYSSFKNQFKNKRGEYLSFNLSIPIFSGFSRSASVKRAKARVYIAENNRDDIFRKLYSDIEQAVADANGQADEYYLALKQKESAEIAHNVNTRKYEEGMIDPILLHTSANRLQKAKAEIYRAKYMYQLKNKLVSYYKGEPLFTE